MVLGTNPDAIWDSGMDPNFSWLLVVVYEEASMSKCTCFCDKCGMAKQGAMSRHEYEQEISKALKLKSNGKSINGNPLWQTWKKQWLADVFKAITKLIKENEKCKGKKKSKAPMSTRTL